MKKGSKTIKKKPVAALFALTLIFLTLSIVVIKLTHWEFLSFGLSITFLVAAFISLFVCGLRVAPKRTKTEAMWDAFWNTLIGKIWP